MDFTLAVDQMLVLVATSDGQERKAQLGQDLLSNVRNIHFFLSTPCKGPFPPLLLLWQQYIRIKQC